jgi:hypothetical protein
MGDTATRFDAVKPRIVKGENSALIGLLLIGLGVMRQHCVRESAMCGTPTAANCIVTGRKCARAHRNHSCTNVPTLGVSCCVEFAPRAILPVGLDRAHMRQGGVLLRIAGLNTQRHNVDAAS